MSLFGPAKNRRRATHEERRSSLAHAGKGLFRLIAILALLGGAGAGTWYGGRSGWAWLTTSKTFALDRLEVEGAQRLSPDAVRKASGLAVGENVFRADLAAAEAQLAQIPWVRRAEVTRELPRTVRIRLEERQPVAQVAIGALYLVDDEGDLFKRAAAADGVDLPLGTGLSRERFEKDPAGVRVDLSRALELLGEVQRRKLPELSEIHVDPSLGLTAHLGDGATAVELGWGDLAGKLDRLERARAELARRRLAVSSIDLTDSQHPERLLITPAERNP